MVVLGTLNGRMKDFYDIWLLAQTFDFEGDQLSHVLNLGRERPVLCVSELTLPRP